MARDLSDHLRRSAVRTFEELAFVFTDSELDQVQMTAPFEAGAWVAFDGPMRGRLTIHLYGRVLATLTHNMLPDLEESSPAMQLDTLKEIANVICGNLLPNLAGQEAVFDLHPPESEDSDALPDVARSPAARVPVGLETGRAELLLYLEEIQSGGEGVVA